MATYMEIRGLFEDSDLRNKVTVACLVAANNLIDLPTPTIAQKKFAELVFSQPNEVGYKATMAMLAENKSKTVAEINALTDLQIQNRVNSVVTALVDALFGA